ncbi:MAG: hypothetical protein JST68_00595 [Bacteroidetes bacterium]|nr:hypothetical protein [Bacteroidota bacterium]
MKNNNYRISLAPIELSATLWQQVLNVHAWWAQDTRGNPRQQGDSFTVRFGKTYATFIVSELTEDRMVWTAGDSYLDLLADTQEWTGTRLVFQHSGNSLDITHDGLTPEKECFKDCEQGWNFFLGHSLLKYLREGAGLPAIGIHAWLKMDAEVVRGTLYSAGQSSGGTTRPMLMLDVKQTKVEQVLSFYDVKPYTGQTDPLIGKYYMLIPDTDGLLEKLEKLI